MSHQPEQSVIVSNGEEFFEIPLSDVGVARGDGFYLPHERGNTVVTNGTETLEIPLDVLADAETDGYRNLIPVPPRPVSRPQGQGGRRKNNQSRASGLAVSGLPQRPRSGPVRIDTGLAAPVDPGQVGLDTGQAEAEPESRPVLIETDEQEQGPVNAQTVLIEVAVDEEEEYRREIRDQIDGAESLALKVRLLLQLYRPTPDQIRKFCSTHGVSVGLHVVVLILLSFLVFESTKIQDGGAVIASVIGADELIEADELPEEVRIEESEDSQTAEAADPAGALSDSRGAAEDLSSFAGANVGGGLEGLSEALGKGVDQMAGEGEKASAAFFGSRTLASRFVFVIDNSLSMTRGRFETALNELAKTVMALKPQQSFYIIFYSDTAYGQFHPQTFDDLIPATRRNQQLTLQWLLTVELCLKTDFADALKMAFALNPDVIFVLGDGGFTDARNVQAAMSGRSEQARQVRIHTLGMELNGRGVKNFQELSEATGGTYRDVGVHPLGAEMAKRNPRKRNNSRGPVWGIKLP